MSDSYPTSYWHATCDPLVPHCPLPTEAEAVVIGGGLLGVWTAVWLARADVPVVLLEKDVISWGATGRNGGFLRAGTAAGFGTLVESIGLEAAIGLERLTARGQALAEEVIRDEHIECDFRKPGTVSMALDDGQLGQMQDNVALLNQHGFPGEIVDHAQIARMMSTAVSPEVVGGVYFADGGLLHSVRYLRAVAEAAQRHGARMVRAGVDSLRAENGEIVIATDQGEVRTARAVVALNAWTDTLVPELAGKVVPVRGQILAHEPIDRVFDVGIGAAVTPTGEYWQQTPDGSIVIGGCRADAPGGDMGVREMRPTPEVIAKIADVVPRLFPELSHLKVAREWAGLMAFTSDYLPVADAIPGVPGVWVTGGYCGHGMPFGPRVGELLAEAVQTGTTPAELGPLRIDRPGLRVMETGAAEQGSLYI